MGSLLLAIASAAILAIVGGSAAAYAQRSAPSASPLWREYPLTVERPSEPRAMAPAAPRRTAARSAATARSGERRSSWFGPAPAAILAAALAAAAFAARAAAVAWQRALTGGTAGSAPVAPAGVAGPRPARRLHLRRLTAGAASLPATARRLAVAERRRRRLRGPDLPFTLAGAVRLLPYAALVALAAVLGGLIARLTAS